MEPNVGVGTGGTIAAIAASTMTANFAAPEDRSRAICGDCRGLKYDRRPGHCGSCQRCRGKGYTEVGNTKR